MLELFFTRGASVKKTKLSDEFNFTTFRELYGESAIVLFVIDENRKLIISTADRTTEPTSGQTIIAGVEQRETAEKTGNSGEGIN